MIKNGGNGGRYSHADLRPKKWRENGGKMAVMPDIPDARAPGSGCRRESMRMVAEKAMAARRYVVLNRWGEVGRCHGAATYSDGAKESMAIYANDYRWLWSYENGTNHPIGARRGIARAEGYPSGGRGAPP